MKIGFWKSKWVRIFGKKYVGMDVGKEYESSIICYYYKSKMYIIKEKTIKK